MHDSIGRTAVVAVCAVLIGDLRAVQSASFDFNLTATIGADFNSFPESVVDLNMAFQNVESAEVRLSGKFTPGLVTLVTVPDHTGPAIPIDTVNLIIRLGEQGTAWIDKSVYAIQDLQGNSGAVEFSLPLQGVVLSTLPVFLPGGELVPDYSFLLDGRFGIAAGSMHWLTTAYQEIDPPRFELTGFVLHVEGTAVPEPVTSLGSLVALLVMIVGRGGRSKRR